jgi:ribose transport system permease protein
MNAKAGQLLNRNPYLLSLILLVLMIIINRVLQDNLFEIGPLNGNLRVFTPAILLAVGQTFVIIAGGVDLSVGAILSMTNAILSTYATGFIFSGIALKILPEPGGRLPRDLTTFYRNPLQITPEFQIPVAFIVIALLIIFWIVLTNTRYRQYLFSTGSKPDAAYSTGVRVNRIKFTTYLFSALFATIAALALTLGSGTGNPRAGDQMTLPSVVAVVLGGTRLAGGSGNIVGSIIGAVILGLIGNIISFADLDSWVRPLVDALIIIAALAIPGLIRFARRLLQ